MERRGYHAGCGELEKVDGRLRCTKCGTVITDAMQLSPRPRVEVQRQQDSGVLLRTYLERRSRYLNPTSFEAL